MIPKIIHQTWKSNKIPWKWKSFVEKVKLMNPDWKYKLWTDDENNTFVYNEFPHFYKTFVGLPQNIMRADVIRYLILSKIGGVYLDLDYEVLQPFEFKKFSLVLPMNRSKKSGDEFDSLGNCIMASAPGHQFWIDVIKDIQENPPNTANYTAVVKATGPLFLSRIYYAGNYSDCWTPERILYHPDTPKNGQDYKNILNSNSSLGIHHGWGSWKDRFSFVYLKRKLFA